MKSLICSEISYDTIDIEKETGIIGATSIKLNLQSISDDDLPTVSIVTPTYNRPEFYDLILRNWERIDYPREKLELIILDDSDIRNNSDIFKSDPNIKYLYSNKKMTIGKKRNYLCNYAKNKFIVHMDDDDWYPPESVVCRIRILLNFQKNEELYCFGCTKVLCIDLINNQMFESFDASEHGTPATISESTLAYSKDFWTLQQWDDSSVMTECLPFIKNRTSKVCTGPSVFIITQFSHINNTVKRRINKTAVSSYNSIRFQQSMSAYDSAIFNKVRANVICKIPEYKESISFISHVCQLKNNQIKKEYNKLNFKIKKNPLIMDYIQEKFVSKVSTSGKDIVYYCGPGELFDFSNEWNPKSPLGGSEEAVVNLSSELVKYGYNVTVYCVLKGHSNIHNGVNYKPYYEWIPKDMQDITIIWRDPSNCKKEINSKKIFLDLHDALSGDMIADIDENIHIMMKSRFHNNLSSNMINAHIIPNGIHPLSYSEPKIKNLLICTCSPDRCIVGLLNAMPLIRRVIPDAEIHWAYGFDSGVSKGGMETNELTKKWVEGIKERIKNTDGFKNLGKLNSEEVNKLYEKADIFIYPTNFPEIDCISLTKSMSAGCIPVVSPAGAMSEKMNFSKQITKMSNNEIDYSVSSGPAFDTFIDETLEIMKNNNTDREFLAKRANSMYNWGHIASNWIKLF
jgi:glycosyltransferase involved in cell wall biosynthesis